MPLTRSILDSSDLAYDNREVLGEVFKIVKCVASNLEKVSAGQAILTEQVTCVASNLEKVNAEQGILKEQVKCVSLNLEKFGAEQEILKEQLKTLDCKLDGVVADNETLRSEIRDGRQNTDTIMNALKEDGKLLKRELADISSNMDLQEEEDEDNSIPQKLLEAFNLNKNWRVLRRNLEGILEPGSTAHRQLRHVGEDCPGPLRTVGKLGLLELGRHLLQGNVLLDCADSGGYTMLHGAAIGGNLQLVELLLRRGANVEARNQFARTPLMCAAGRGHMDVVMCLVRAGADTSARSMYSLSAADYAKKNGHALVVLFLT